MKVACSPPPSKIDNTAGTDTAGVKAIVNDLKHISNGHGKGIVREMLHPRLENRI